MRAADSNSSTISQARNSGVGVTSSVLTPGMHSPAPPGASLHNASIPNMFPGAQSMNSVGVNSTVAGRTADAPGLAGSNPGTNAGSLYDGPFRTSPSLPTSALNASKIPNAPYMTAGSTQMQATLQAALERNPFTYEDTLQLTDSKIAHYSTTYRMEPSMQRLSTPGCENRVSMMLFTSNKYSERNVVLRCIENNDGYITETIAKNALNKCKHFRHPSLVGVNSILASADIGGGNICTVVESRFVPGSVALDKAFPSNEQREQGVHGATATEGLIWSVACQLYGMIRSFHDVGCAVGGLHTSKILFCSDINRVIYSGIGLNELCRPVAAGSDGSIEFSSDENQLVEDVVQFGTILAQLAIRGTSLTESEVHKATHLSQSMKTLINSCLSGVPLRTLNELLSTRLTMEIAYQQGHVDYLRDECVKALQNGRFMRLLMRFNFVVVGSQMFQDRAELSSQCNVLRLFNEYVFYQVNNQQNLKLDWGHAYHCLNKLDSGSPELIQLLDIHNNVVIVASYSNIKMVLEDMCRRLQNEAGIPSLR